ncbi:hypothetical protein J7E63_16680 [Bacillus sp. ISL-75]|uniref:hypothetical protein n=1 Tax=Bacillus sp. ISL-75 TaxID=2819137 RepID=UPI001BE81451|nr:hypothetical protein [Bacillus sp. ISL-75]MBT2728562.1 hypothetical protein [Bacillus sp. ISL-75]
MEKINLLDEINDSSYKVALLTSFSTDLVFFEKMILRFLTNQNCTYIGMFIDGKSLQEAVIKPNIKELGKHYIVKGIQTDLAFHPKIYLLLGEKKAKVMIGSGNLTPAGFLTNHEVFNVFSYDEEKEDTHHIGAIQEAFRLFQAFHGEKENRLWNTIFNIVRDFSYLFHPIADNRMKQIISNYSQPLEEQLKGILPENIQLIECFVPYFDRTLTVLEKWRRDFAKSDINVYLQNGTTNFPSERLLGSSFSLYEAIFIQDASRRYHGKVVRFVGEVEEVIVYGSANCSHQAFLQSFLQGGNCEAVVVEKGPKGTFDSFFKDSIDVKHLIPETFEVIDQDETGSKQISPIRFVEGLIEQGKITVRVQSSIYIDDLLIRGEKGIIKEFDSTLWIFEFNDVVYNNSTIMQMECLSNGETYTFFGWFHHVETLRHNFENLKKLPYEGLKEDPYLEDYHNMVNLLEDLHHRLILTEEDMEEKRYGRNQASSIHQQVEVTAGNDENISGNLEDYYIGESLEELKYGSAVGIDVLGNLINTLLRPFYHDATASLEITSGSGSSHQKEAPTKQELTVDLKEQLIWRMYRFTKKLHQGMLSPSYLAKIDSDAFIKNMTIYSGFLFKLYERLGSELYTKDQMVDEFYQILKAIENYSDHQLLDPNRDDMQFLLVQSLATIFMKDYLLREEDNFHFVRGVKIKLGLHLKHVHQQIQPIRNSYAVYTDLILNHLKKLNFNVTGEEIEKTLEERFPFITYDQLIKKLTQFNGIDKDHLPTIHEPRVYSDLDLKPFSYDFNILQLHLLYSMVTVDEWEKQTSFYIIWKNNNPKSNLRRLVLYFNQKKGILRKKYVYRNGLDPRKEEKRHVSKSQLLAGAIKGEVSILAEGFKEMVKK